MSEQSVVRTGRRRHLRRLLVLAPLVLCVGIGAAFVETRGRSGAPARQWPAPTSIATSPGSIASMPPVALPSSDASPPGPSASAPAPSPTAPSTPPASAWLGPSEMRTWIRSLPDAQLSALIGTRELDRYMTAAFPISCMPDEQEAQIEAMRVFLDDVNRRILALNRSLGE